ncbi:unnamed protein product [Phytomonas sp. EM1]|nr:unnamed protein product [Phytomonas sp. EM1]|eukprot:CCW64122.1 unnamed protein product [Phytomonas sp. isolate EM1]
MLDEESAANGEGGLGEAVVASTSALLEPDAMETLQRTRRVRRTRARYERLQPPPGVLPGEPVPSIEGWILLLTQLPPCTTTEDVESLFALFREGDPDYFGVVQKVKIPLDKDCLCPGYALVELDSEEGFRRALAELQGTPVPIGLPPDTPPEEIPRLRVSPVFLAEEAEVEEEPREPLPGEKRPRE